MSNYQIDNGAHKIRISTGGKNLGKVSNKSTTWSKLIGKMAQPQLDLHHTLPQYLELTVARQGELKNVGFFVGGHCDNGVRRIETIRERWLVTLDVDACTPAHVFDLVTGMSDLSQYEFFVYSTRKHTQEKPRIRVIIPLAVACEAEAYHALSRILAEKLDVTMESVDPVSYRVTQLMYWPSVCKDAEFFTYHNEGELVVPDDVLNGFGDWRDHTKLPRSERDDTRFNAAGKKPEDPEKKEGFVGAFCRVYDIPAAIENFLSDLYVDPVETHHGTRYTYANGTTAHGAIVYDDGKFLFSNHMHDPAAGHSQNAFDLVRIHLFKDLDKKVREDTSPMNYPSVKAMVEMVKDDKEVKRDLSVQNYDIASMFREDISDDDTFEDLDADDGDLAKIDKKKSEKINENWFEELELNSEGVLKQTLHNVVTILTNDPRFKNSVRRNLFSGHLVYDQELSVKTFGYRPLYNVDKKNGSLWTDTHTRYVKSMLESPRGKKKPGYGLKVSKEDLNDAIGMAAEIQSFHPVKAYLDELEWDGICRAETVFIDYLGCEDDAYHRDVCRLTLLAAVTRIYEPGHKFDYMPILEGSQGIRKSAFVKALACGWFREMGDIDDRNRAIESMSGAWILEFAELHQFNRTESNRIKAFLSSQDETTRLAYERNPRKYSRQCVFIGTTNQGEYLKDETGNRRFWPVACRIVSINIDKLVRNLPQIWAEAVYQYKSYRFDNEFGELPLYLQNEQASLAAAKIQNTRRAETTEEILAQAIADWLETPVSFEETKGIFVEDENFFEDSIEDKSAEYLRDMTCNVEIYEKVVGNDRRKITQDKSTQTQIGKAMRMIAGWERLDKQTRYGKYGKQSVLYVRTKTENDEI